MIKVFEMRIFKKPKYPRILKHIFATIKKLPVIREL